MLLAKGIYYFFSKTAERNSMKLRWKQDLNILYQFCVFRTDQKNKMDTWTSDWLKHFLTSLQKPLSRIQTNLTGSKVSTSSTNFMFFGPNRKNKMAAPASDWLRHFQLFLWNHWMEFNKTWQKARSCPLPRLCFSGRSVNRNGLSGGSVKKVAHGTQMHDMLPFGPLVSPMLFSGKFWYAFALAKCTLSNWNSYDEIECIYIEYF